MVFKFQENLIVKMGNSQTQKQNILQLNSNDSKYRIIRKQANKAVIQFISNQQTFLLIEHHHSRKEDHDNMMQKFRRYASLENVNDNVLSLTKIESEEYFNLCSTSYKISAIYEYPEITLQDQIYARQKANQLFEQNDLWSILQSCINGLIILKPSASINLTSVFILSDGVIKVAHNDMLDQEYRFVVNENYFYAPEKIEHFFEDDRQANLRKESIFSLGMTILSAAILENLNNCYDYKNCIFYVDRIQKYLRQCEELVSEGLFQVISSMVEIDPNKRLSIQQLQQLINDSWKSELSESGVSIIKSVHKAKKVIQINQFQNDGEYYKQNRQLKVIPEKTLKPKQSSHLPLSELKDNVNYKDSIYSGFSSSTLQPYMPQLPISNKNSQYNLFTDPKLLQMIREDMKDLATSRNQLQNVESLRILLGNKKNESQDTNSLQSFSLNNSIKFSTANFGQLEANINKKYDNNSPKSKKTLNNKDIHFQNGINTEKTNTVRYQGELVNDKKQGYGRLTYADGSYYVGYFKNNEMHGQGQLYSGPNKPVYQGGWKNNKFDGFGIQYSQYSVLLNQQFDYRDFSNADEYWAKFQGHFSQDMKNGKGTLTLSNGEVFQGFFKNDMVHGKGKWTNLKGKKIEGVWQKNMLIAIKQYA